MIARQMVTRWGMSDRLGTVSFSDRQSPFLGGSDTGAPSHYSETTAEIIDEEVERIVRTCYDRALELLTTHRATLDRIAQELRLHETIDANQLRQIMEETGAYIAPKAPLPKGSLVDLAPPPPTEPPVPPVNS
jgi:cell division protease FtsH